MIILTQKLKKNILIAIPIPGIVPPPTVLFVHFILQTQTFSCLSSRRIGASFTPNSKIQVIYLEEYSFQLYLHSVIISVLSFQLAPFLPSLFIPFPFPLSFCLSKSAAVCPGHSCQLCRSLPKFPSFHGSKTLILVRSTENF